MLADYPKVALPVAGVNLCQFTQPHTPDAPPRRGEGLPHHGRRVAAERRTQPFALMSRLSVFGVPLAQTLAVFTLSEAIPGLVGWRELFANRPVGGVRTGHNLLASVLEQLGREQFS